MNIIWRSKMKTALTLAFLLGIMPSLKAADIVINPPVEQAIVELHITEAESPKAEKDKHKKSQRLQEAAGHAICSGAFITPSGLILTAKHCTEGAASIDVVTFDQQHYAATIIATSPKQDLALLHVARNNAAYLPPASEVTRGERVFVLGSPLGITGVLNSGIVAKLDGDHMLLDCSALPGNSGGPVTNENGQLIGVVVAGYWVGFGTTHLNLAQSLDSLLFFVRAALKG
jgi:S1-C subfamily serine protease